MARWGVRARAVANPEMRGGDRHGRRGEGRAWPAPRHPRVEARRHTQLLVGREFAADEAAVLGALGRVLAARPIDLDIVEALFVEIRAEHLTCLRPRLVGDAAPVELGDRAAG